MLALSRRWGKLSKRMALHKQLERRKGMPHFSVNGKLVGVCLERMVNIHPGISQEKKKICLKSAGSWIYEANFKRLFYILKSHIFLYALLFHTGVLFSAANIKTARGPWQQWNWESHPTCDKMDSKHPCS